MKLWTATKNRIPLERARKPKEEFLMCGWWGCSRKEEKRAYDHLQGFRRWLFHKAWRIAAR